MTSFFNCSPAHLWCNGNRHPHKSNNEHSQSLIDKDKVKEIYKISKSTLYRSKKKNQIIPVKIIGQRDYYRVTEIEKIANKK